MPVDAPRAAAICCGDLISPDDEDTVVEEDITAHWRPESESHATQTSRSASQLEDSANILVAITNGNERRRYVDAFRTAGYRAGEATDGLSCLLSLRSEAFDMLVIDQHLLWGSGDGVVEVMHHDPSIDQIPVVLLNFPSPDDPLESSTSSQHEFGCDDIVRIVQQRLAGNF
tara:strand:- start:33945 stop:34460 length:516 start_codon:yes stop_codon:yes gene_type:complete